MKIHYFQHVPYESLGYIESWLNEKGHSFSSTKFYLDHFQIPAINQIDALILMGGPMSVRDENRFPWLKEEKGFIKKCIQANKKILGICLGAQLIADCLEEPVTKAENKEIGWFKVSVTNETSQVKWFHELFLNDPVVFHWHREMSRVGNKSSNLLRSEANPNQAFIFQNNCIGLQFHVEVTERLLDQMLQNSANELDPEKYVQSKNTILEGKKYIPGCNKIMAEILEKWLE